MASMVHSFVNTHRPLFLFTNTLKVLHIDDVSECSWKIQKSS